MGDRSRQVPAQPRAGGGIRTRRGPALLAALGVATALALGACDSGGGSSGPSGASTSGDAACSLATPFATSPSSSSSPGRRTRGTPTGRIGVVVAAPAHGVAPRPREVALLRRALQQAGLTPEVRRARDGGPGALSLARGLIKAGVRVLVVGARDPAAGARVERLANRAGVEVIEYGGVILGGTAPYTVSLDYVQIGRLEAQAMVGCLESRGLTRPTVILVDGGTDVDENAVLLAIGAHQVLDPLVTAGRLELASETTVRGWRTSQAGAAFGQALQAAGDKVDGVLVADDALANAVIDVLRQRQLDGTVVVGQGSGQEGLQNVVAGRQSATVYADPEREARDAAVLARALVTGDVRALAALPLATFDDPMAPSRDLKALLVPGQVVTRATAYSVAPRDLGPSGGSPRPSP